MKKQNYLMELLHYVVVYGVLVASWLPIMNYFKDDINLTVATGLVVFIVADQLAHKYILNEK